MNIKTEIIESLSCNTCPHDIAEALGVSVEAVERVQQQYFPEQCPVDVDAVKSALSTEPDIFKTAKLLNVDWKVVNNIKKGYPLTPKPLNTTGSKLEYKPYTKNTSRYLITSVEVSKCTAPDSTWKNIYYRSADYCVVVRLEKQTGKLWDVLTSKRSNVKVENLIEVVPDQVIDVVIKAIALSDVGRGGREERREKASKRLSDEERELITKHLISGRSVRATAMLFNVSPNTVALIKKSHCL